jgi:L-rhamnose mutarotase
MRTKLSKIADNVFLACVKNASFKLNINNAFPTDDGSLCVEIEGNLDYAPIGESLDGAKENLKNLANQFSSMILDKQTQSENSSLKKILNNIKSIEPEKYSIYHDEANNKMFLVLPYQTLHNIEDDKNPYLSQSNKVDKIGEIIKVFEEIYNRNKVEIDNDSDKSNIDVTFEREYGDTVQNKELEDLSVSVFVQKGIGKKKDSIFERIYLKVLQSYKDGRTVVLYNKHISDEIKFPKLKTEKGDKELEIEDIFQDNKRIAIYFKNGVGAIDLLRTEFNKNSNNVKVYSDAFKKDLEKTLGKIVERKRMKRQEKKEQQEEQQS